MTPRRIRAKVLIDTFVQWLRICASGLITVVGAGWFKSVPHTCDMVSS